MRNYLLLILGACAPSILMAGMFSWTDKSGNLVFGDTPPQGVTAIPLNPPKLTVLEGFADRYQAAETEMKAKPPASRAVVSKPKVVVYEQLNVIAPKQSQAIRANDGDVSVALSFSPKLRPGDKIVFNLDGKEVLTGTSKVANMTNLDRGSHTLTVSIINRLSRKLISSEAIKFVVLRSTTLNKKPLNPYASE
ncbi:DUF4124 domain-containing protein [Leucothrix arctica]|uniref:DUF4124 domain-containing protein n=1 Tax=Leucothrix arctica TaxID=1481894 RepID=A0A317CQX3_9GAMM|nr:DUF4124 domain-containing protein [Leucothrix arctica]PWQ98810.1 hypothetical protein DKT75_03120 [Leucothrix arctica]